MLRFEKAGMSAALRVSVLTLALAVSFAAAAQDARRAPAGAPLSQTPSQAQEECQAKLREYRESVACFDRFRTVNHGVRPEAFKHCKEVAQPSGCHYSEASAPPTRYIDPAKPR